MSEKEWHSSIYELVKSLRIEREKEIPETTVVACSLKHKG